VDAKEALVLVQAAHLVGLPANLRGANLSWADLPGADLREADLRWANLRGANLWGANLWGAKLSGANLRGANLSGANLGDAVVLQIGPIGSRKDYLVYVRADGAETVSTGCYQGGLDAFEAKVEQTHGNNQHGRAYRAVIAMLRALPQCPAPAGGAT